MLRRRIAGGVAALVVLLLPLVFASDPGTHVHASLVLLPVLGAMYGQRRGALAGWVASLFGLAAFAAVRHANGLEVDADDLAFWAGLGAVTGALAARLVGDARAAAAEAVAHATRAQGLARRWADAAHDLEVLHAVVVAGIGGTEDEVLERMVHALADQLGYPSISIVRRRSDGELELAATSDAAVAAAASVAVPVLPGGPLARALRGDGANRSTSEEGRLLTRLIPTSRSTMVAPIAIGSTIVGALIADAPVEDAFDGHDVDQLARLGDQMGLVVAAARAYDRESELAHRFRELDRMKTDFIAITSHELRTPLTSILGFAETLLTSEDRLSPAARRGALEAIARQGRRLARLVDDLRTVSRLDAGTLDIELTATDVDRAIRDAIESVEIEDHLHLRGAVGTWVHADPYRLHQVVVNLLRNAREHGGDHLTVKVERAGGIARISVADDGPGVPEEAADEIFERFVQAGPTDAHGRGSGLGLAIGRELCRAMGGELELDTGHTTGARFVITLRAAEPPLAAGDDERQRPLESDAPTPSS